MLQDRFLMVEGLVREFRNRETDNTYRVAVPRLEIDREEFVVCIGPTGSGKSTLLNILSLLDQPTCVRKMTYLGFDLRAAWQAEREIGEIRRRFIGFAQQRPALLSALSVRENIEIPLRLNGVADTGPRVDVLLERFGSLDAHGRSDLRRVAEGSVHNLSGGQALRVALARAVIHRPALLLADEPTANLDPPTARRVLGFLNELRDTEGLTVVMVTQQLSLVRPFATKLVQFAACHRGLGKVVSVKSIRRSTLAPRLPAPPPTPINQNKPSDNGD